MTTLMGRIKMYILTYMYNYVLWPVCFLTARLPSTEAVIQLIFSPVSSLIDWHYHPARRNISWFTWLGEAFITILVLGLIALFTIGVILAVIGHFGVMFGYNKEPYAILNFLLEYIIVAFTL